MPTGCGDEQFALDPLAELPSVMPHWLRIEEAALAGVALLCQDDLYLHQLGLVGQHLNEAGMGEAGMGQEDKCLVRALAQTYVLLPAVILADDEGAYPMLGQHVDD